ncbi:MAG: ORC1-type DNA replication protein [Nanoarchaeota archaeon]
MLKKGLKTFFEDYLEKEPLFINKKALQMSYTPKYIPHREEQIEAVASILAPSLRGERPSNIFIYGKTGTGKSLTITYVTQNIKEIAQKNKTPLRIIYLNCKLKRVADTEYRIIAQLTREFGEQVPATGLPTDEIYKLFIQALQRENKNVIIILDEIDQLVKKTGDEILYNLTRLNGELENTQISIIGISNDLLFTDNIDPRIKSSLSEEELVFPPYNALQLQSILKQRSKLAFKESIVKEGVIEKCSAYAAREHGDARRALDLLRVAGEIAERKGAVEITTKHIDDAEEKIERDRVVDIINTQPKQVKLTLYSIFTVSIENKGPIFTGDIYELYKEACYKTGVKPLTQRRVSDIIAELDMLGIINAKVISKGRYGRTREIGLAIPQTSIPNINNSLKESLAL